MPTYTHVLLCMRTYCHVVAVYPFDVPPPPPAPTIMVLIIPLYGISLFNLYSYNICTLYIHTDYIHSRTTAWDPSHIYTHTALLYFSCCVE